MKDNFQKSKRRRNASAFVFNVVSYLVFCAKTGVQNIKDNILSSSKNGSEIALIRIDIL